MAYPSQTLLYAYSRFKRVSLLFLGLGILVALSSFLFYSPNASLFSTRSSLFCLSVTGNILGGGVFIIGTAVSAFLLLPRDGLPPDCSHYDYPKHRSIWRDEPLLSKYDDELFWRDYERRKRDDEDYNPANPASLSYVPPPPVDYSSPVDHSLDSSFNRFFTSNSSFSDF